MSNSSYEILLVDNRTLEENSSVDSTIEPLRNQQFMQKLKQTHPELQVAQVELMEIRNPETGTEIHIRFDEGSASLRVPFHASGDTDAAWSDAWKYLELFTKQTDYLAFDPQLDRRVNLEADYDRVVSSYREKGAAAAGRSGLDDSKRSWWKFW